MKTYFFVYFGNFDYFKVLYRFQAENDYAAKLFIESKNDHVSLNTGIVSADSFPEKN